MGKDQELLEAARNGNFATVEKILISKTKRSGPLASLRRGPGANVQDASGYSALHHAALNGHKNVVELLLTNEASTNIVDVKGSSPLHLAAWSGNVDIVRMILSHGPSIPNVNLMTKDNETALHCAAQYGHTEVVCLLLEYSCDPTIRNTKQETALDLAAQYGRLETVDMLVRTHPELIQPYNGSTASNFLFPHTPLHLASRNGHKAVVDVLLAGGMNVNVRTTSGTALHEAAMCGKTEVVRTLLKNGIDLNIRDAQNNTVLDVLKQFPCHVVHDIYSLIKKYRAIYNEHNDLFQASFSGSPYDYSLDSASPRSVSPMHFNSYDRRTSLSGASDILHNRYTSTGHGTCGLSKSLMDTNHIDDYIRSRDCDSVSICSTASSCCSRRSPHLYSNIGGQLPSPGSISNKISPTPPKKPPRRTVPISPTHTMSSVFSSSEQNGHDGYEYAFVRVGNAEEPEYIVGQEYSNLKRKSRDIETETEEELLLLVFPGTTYETNDTISIGSFSSNISLSDKSVSTEHNTVEEFVGDAPFAGLLKGSITPLSDSSHYGKLERPTSLNRLKIANGANAHLENGHDENQAKSKYQSNSCAADQTNVTMTNGAGNGATNSADANGSMSILSPFDEQEELAKISEIMASFGSNFNRESIVTELEQEFDSRLGFTKNEIACEQSFTSVQDWLQWVGFSEYEKAFINFGYDDIDFINGVITDCDLKEIGIMVEEDRDNLLKHACTLPNRVHEFWAPNKHNHAEKNGKDLVKEWLQSIHLVVYLETFRKNLFVDMDRIKRIWEVELTAVLEITKPGHRRRILASVNVGKLQGSLSVNDLSVSANLDYLHAGLDQLKCNIQELEEEICMKTSGSKKGSHSAGVNGTTNNTNSMTALVDNATRYRKKSRPAPPPPPPPPPKEPDLEIRNPSELLVGVPVTLKAQWRHKPAALVTGTLDYVASYLGSTVVKELRGTESTKKSIQKLKKSTSVVDCRITPEIVLAISYRGVKFLNLPDRSLICEHEIRNIHCACQDSEDLTHFAYITKDRASKTHYCHVFCVHTMDQATEVILTLGQAFEVAYQMALKEECPSHRVSNHSRSQSLTNSVLMTGAGRGSGPRKTGPTLRDIGEYFTRAIDNRLPIVTLISQGKYQDVRRILDAGNATEVKTLKKLILCVGSAAFREANHVEKDVADDVYSYAVNELKARCFNVTHLVKYYHTSFNETNSPLREADLRTSAGKAKLYRREKNGRVPMWVMVVEEKFDEIRLALGLGSDANDVEACRRIASDVSNKTFRDAYHVDRDVADEVFECVTDEMMAREVSVGKLVEYYNASYK